ncbi:MAG: hypothetical protein RMJ98_13885 [Myxococcales bacterium]|nr:hypothetical protein [Polyangiaceae bacterium]MDW8250382.1 hypothetical protein [Myxococcales bacterium]
MQSDEGPPLPPIGLWIEPVLPPDWPQDGMGPLAVITSQIPAADTVPQGTWIAIRPSRACHHGLLQRLLRKPAYAHLALRCTALLARGYEHVGAGMDGQGQEVAWGRSPELSRS